MKIKIPNIVKPFETEKEKKLRASERVRLRSRFAGGARPARPARPAAAVYPRRSVCLFVVLAGRLGWCSGSRLRFGGGGRGGARSWVGGGECGLRRT